MPSYYGSITFFAAIIAAFVVSGATFNVAAVITTTMGAVGLVSTPACLYSCLS